MTTIARLPNRILTPSPGYVIDEAKRCIMASIGLVLGGAGQIGRVLGQSAAAAAAADNGLLTALIAYWPGNEAAGNAIDAHTNGLDLTDVNTVTNNPGIVYPTARQYTTATNEYHTRLGDDALLSMGDVDMTIATWVYADTWPYNVGLVSKYIAASQEYRLVQFGYRFRWYVRNPDDSGDGIVVANALGVPATLTWYMVLVYHDAVNNEIGIQINNGAVDTLAWTFGIRDVANAFRIGTFAVVTDLCHDGRIGPTAIWKSAAAGGGVLTADQRTALYNGGAGLTYAGFTS